MIISLKTWHFMLQFLQNKIINLVTRTSTELDERNDFDRLVIKVVVETDLLVRG